MPQEPMIWVRKPDGSKVRMTLAEFRMSKQKTPSVAHVPPQQNQKVSQETSQSHEWDKEDHASLMETDLANALPMVVSRSSVSTNSVSFQNKTEAQNPSRLLPQELSRLIESARERPILQDIRPNAQTVSGNRLRRAMGPVDELGNMTLVDLRRLGSTPSQIGEVVVKKFTTLKTDTFLQYVAGIKAWEESPVYKAYIQVLEEALKSGETIVEYTSRTPKEDHLTAEEVALVQQIHATIRL